MAVLGCAGTLSRVSSLGWWPCASGWVQEVAIWGGLCGPVVLYTGPGGDRWGVLHGLVASQGLKVLFKGQVRSDWGWQHLWVLPGNGALQQLQPQGLSIRETPLDSMPFQGMLGWGC